MSKITQLELWDDTGFTEGCVEVPSLSNVLPTPTHTYTTQLTPDTTRLFSEIKVPYPYTDLMNSSYLKITLTLNNNTTRYFCGWIDKVSIVSDTSDYPNTLIQWHVDYWRTYLSQAVFGYGRVSRRPASDTDPIQTFKPRFKTIKGYTDMNYTGVGSNALWVIMNVGGYEDDDDVVGLRTVIIPVTTSKTALGEKKYFKLQSTDPTRECPSLFDFIDGSFDEKMGVTPKQISSVFVTPIPPFGIVSGDGSSSSPYVLIPSGEVPISEETEWRDVEGQGFLDNAIGQRITGCELYLESSTRHVRVHEENPENTVDTDNGSGLVAELDKWHGENSPMLTEVGSGEENWKMKVTTRLTIGPTNYDDYMYVKADDFCSFMAGYDNVPNGTKIYGSDDIWFLTGATRTVQILPAEGGYYRRGIAMTGTISRADYITKTDGTFGSDVYVMMRNKNVSWKFTHPDTVYNYQVSEFHIVDKQKSYKYAFYCRNGKFSEYTIDLPNTVTTTSTDEAFLTDKDGTVLGNVPFGHSISRVKVRNVISGTNAYLQVRADNIDSSIKGLQWTIPLPTIDLSSNSWSAYIISGERQYNIQSKRLAREQALAGVFVENTIGLGEQAIGTALTRGTSPINISGYASTMLHAGANYDLQGYFDDRLQGLTDELQSKQLDNIIMAGTGWDWHYHGRQYRFVTMTGDSYSVTRYDNMISANGISCDEPTANCTSLINSGGALQITDLIVRGNIPVEAKQYIKSRFGSGVRLV